MNGGKSIFDSNVRNAITKRCWEQKAAHEKEFITCALQVILHKGGQKCLVLECPCTNPVQCVSVRSSEKPIKNSYISWIALEYGDVALFRLLMDYKIDYVLGEKVDLCGYVIKGNEQEIINDMHDSDEERDLELGYWKWMLSRFFLNTSFAEEIPIELENYQNLTKRRLWYVLLGFEALCKMQNAVKNRQKIRCFIMMFQFTSQPHVTSTEIEDILKYLLRGRDDAEDFIFQFCKEFEATFPKSARPYQPRSLKHLSRCQVQQDFRIAKKDLHDLKNLPLPQTLIEYVLCDVNLTEWEIEMTDPSV